MQAIATKDQEEKIDTLFLLPILTAMPFFFGNNHECFLKASCRACENANMSSFILSLYFLYLYFCGSL
ncbi:hypothetical protein EDC96DRAFT_535070 [Choanephora cucurbitarum]|nr:hypothetical protein EDC96DRAFT_535070 [Choanephora cucurbitarum]